MAPSYLYPKRPRWAVWCAGVAIASLLSFAAWSWWTPWRPGRFGGLLFGSLAGLIFVFEAAYPLRRRLMARPLATAQDWLQLHIYGGLLACLFVWLHIGFQWPVGLLGWGLLLLTMWATATGLLGVFLQKRVPAMLAGDLSVEAIYERIPELLDRLPAQADELVREASETLRTVYLSDVRPALVAGPPGLAQLWDLRRYRDSRLEPLIRVRPFIPETDRERAASLESLLQERVELEAHQGLQRLMRSWLIIHVPPALVLMGLVVVHVFAVWFF